jgi:hypothetical protein
MGIWGEGRLGCKSSEERRNEDKIISKYLF